MVGVAGVMPIWLFSWLKGTPWTLVAPGIGIMPRTAQLATVHGPADAEVV